MSCNFVAQVVVQYETEELDLVLKALEGTTAHLTAAIVSKDIQFQNKVRRDTKFWFCLECRWLLCD